MRASLKQQFMNAVDFELDAVFEPMSYLGAIVGGAVTYALGGDVRQAVNVAVGGKILMGHVGAALQRLGVI